LEACAIESNKFGFSLWEILELISHNCDKEFDGSDDLDWPVTKLVIYSYGLIQISNNFFIKLGFMTVCMH